MPIAKTGDPKEPAGSTVFAHGGFHRAEGSETAVVAETSLGIYDSSQFKELVLLSNVTAIAGVGATLVFRVYNVDIIGTRIGTALITNSHTATGSLRATATVIGNKIEITKQLSGTTPTTTATVELQMKT